MSRKNESKTQAFAVTSQEFLYYDVRSTGSSGQNQWRSLPHRIIKRTPKFVYVAAEPYDSSDQNTSWVNIAVETIRLDRAALEKWGYAFVSFGDADRYALDEPLFYTTPYSERVSDAGMQPDCFALLELSPPYNIAAVKSAYRRLAKQHHPDRGGAAARFLALQVAYRQALEILGG